MAMDANVRLAAFILVLVGGILGTVGAIRPALNTNNLAAFIDADFLLLLIGGVLALVAALRGWNNQPRDAGLLGLIGGVLILLGGNDLAGVLALVGGVIYLVK